MAEKPVIESKHQLQPGPASSFISRELKAGGIAYVYVGLERSYDLPPPPPPQKATLDIKCTLS